MKRKACVILPTYNEVENIPIILPSIFKQEQKIDTHDLYVVVVDDDSPDGTQAVVNDLDFEAELVTTRESE